MENISNEQILNAFDTISFLKKRCIDITNIIDVEHSETIDEYPEEFDINDLSRFEIENDIDKRINIYENILFNNSDLTPYIYITFKKDIGRCGQYEFEYYCFNIPLRYINESDENIRKEISILIQERDERQRLEKIEKEKQEAIQKAEKKEKERIAYENKIKAEYERICNQEKNATS